MKDYQLTIIENTSDSILSVQIATSTINDIPQPKEVIILIEEDEHSLFSALTVPQTKELIKVLQRTVSYIENEQ